ncbi:hypothetical protein [Rheinheimera sp.]|uniref:hypothetical protein n=1 Tax=Rheinheimera sp. TaxID=1869214 RepID=UPI00307CFED2
MPENYSYALIELFKQKKGITKNRDVVALLDGMNEGNLSNIKAGNRHLTPEQGLYIAEQCGLDIGEVLVKLDMERAKSPAVQEALSSLLKRIAGAVAVISLSMGLIMTPVSEAKASA